ncbi:UNVERIFIED_CONTAM: hypothetical protein Sradi_6841600 [Sesamum radiatum]|uniref:Aminotransferase-like plant mobile domain-containing protein n=1 Tax=Sesamum radiatum TaxID=300843 RepID=A0AAW2JL99_SESRA
MSLLVTNHQMTSPIYALWAVLSYEGDAKWDDDLRFTREFCSTKGYWEWTEDVLHCLLTSHSFPIHFVYAWLACYFKTHYSVWQELRGPKMTRFSGEGGAKYYELREARKRIHKAKFVSWAWNMLVKDGPFKFVDDGHAEELDHDYFIAIRSCYLTLRQGSRFIIEPYSPYRFGRQFGYYQDVPKTLKYDTCVASLEEGLRYWRLCVLSKSLSKAWFPCPPTNAKKLCSEAYKAWWAKVHGTFFEDNIESLIRPKSIKITLKRKTNEDKQVDGSENNPPHVLVSPVAIECDSQAAIAEASKEKGSSHNVADSDSSNKDRHWKRQKELTPLKLEGEVQSIDTGEESETSHSLTMTPPLGMGLKRKDSPHPTTFHAYDEARSLSFEKLSRSLHEQQLKEAKACLQDVQAKASEEASKVQSAMDELEHIEKEIVALKGRRTSLRATLKGKNQLNHDAQSQS